MLNRRSQPAGVVVEEPGLAIEPEVVAEEPGVANENRGFLVTEEPEVT